jgi:hypothetical protein
MFKCRFTKHAGASHVGDIVTPATKEAVESYKMKVKGIREVLKRDHMKVAFFGR